MGAALQSRISGARRRRRSSYAPMTEINVTPFVDVMLVLLIVFMVTAPLLTVHVPIQLPESQAKPLQGDKEPLAISVNSKGQIFLQETEVQLDTIVSKLLAISQNGYNERIYIRGDHEVDYGVVAKVMGTISGAGFKRIGLVTAPEEIK